MLKWNGGSNTPILNMEKYVILSDCIVKGERKHAGDVVELPKSEGHELVGYGKAEVHKHKEVKKADRSVGLEKSEAPKVSKRKSK
tara:strand:- start:8098 stop:8352 length:255 start_codon:yes stop_codon:yes gene_type:complete